VIKRPDQPQTRQRAYGNLPQNVRAVVRGWSVAISEMHLKMLQWDYDDGLLERKIKKALGHK
jgi:hypothetical protein